MLRPRAVRLLASSIQCILDTNNLFYHPPYTYQVRSEWLLFVVIVTLYYHLQFSPWKSQEEG